MKTKRRFLALPLLAAASIAPVLAGAGSLREARNSASTPVSYGRQIRPILSDRCFVCHGPDPSTREADLRLDTFEFATTVVDGFAAITPGDAENSELYLRISNEDPGEVMPPAKAHRKALDAEELALFRRWIEQGAQYETHWAFLAPEKPTLALEGRNPIDVFVREGLAQAQLEASGPVEPELALRRLFLDLTGLPPTPEETDAYLAECTEGDARTVWADWTHKLFTEEPYRSRYAERMASPWLDQARYADTSGIHTDAGRQIWPWRDWVLEAYRDNMPFDQFLTEQLAGDLIPEATLAQKVASGFNRNHITTDEGGAIDAEYLVEYAADRAETTSAVFLGLTMGCARCHDHKFDPLKQADYYSMFAFFASNEEPGLYTQRPDSKRAFEPFLEVPSAEQLALREELEAELTGLNEALAEPSEADRVALAAFRKQLPGELGLEWAQVEFGALESAGGATLELQADGTILASGTNPERDTHTIHMTTEARELRLIQLDVLRHESFTDGAPGRAGNGNAVLTGIQLEAISVADPSVRQELAIDWLWADAAQDNDDWSLARALDSRPNTGWAIAGHTEGAERVALFLTHEAFGFEGGTELVVTLEYDSIYAQHAFGHVRLGVASLAQEGLDALPLAQERWYHAGPFPVKSGANAYEQQFGPEQAAGLDLAQEFEVTGGGVLRWRFRREFQDGETIALDAGVNIHYVGREIYSPGEREVELSLGSDDGFELFVNGESVAEREVPRGVAADQDRATIALHPGRNTFVFKIVNTGGASGYYYKALQTAERLDADLIAALVDFSAHEDGGAAETEQITHAWRLSRSPEYRAGQEQVAALQARQKELEAQIPRTMVMHERDEPRSVFVLNRGEYDKADESRPVVPGIPPALGSLNTVDEAGAERRATRLDLAAWLTAPDNPLVSRVAVNRLWQLMFGTGLVATSGDFGSQGAWPSHPELLDWLAVEFIESGWDVQHMLTLIVSSETYRQSSAVSAAALERDPENRLLSHYPRRRLDAERLRDQALYVADLLQEDFGGASVKPYQPGGLWREVAMTQSNTRIFERGQGSDLWRRSVYTYWKRACPPPAMMTFDAPTREACVTRRSDTNTPLQALVLWNDEQFLEAARVLAQRTLLAGLETEPGITAMFRRCTGRAPSARELELLGAALADHLAHYQASPEDAVLLVAVGESEHAMDLDDGELAAWTLLASALLNLHATITEG